MRIRVGTTPDRTGIYLQPQEDRPILLVGDPGAGKTTLARFVARWWAADPDRTVHVFADRRFEWADLEEEPRVGVETLDRLGRRALRATRMDQPLLPEAGGGCLTILDGLDEQTANELLLHWSCVEGSTPPSIITSQGGLPEGFVADVVTGGCWAVLPITRVVGTPRRVQLRPDVDPAQGRLDWPAEARPLIPDLRGSRDFPSHRWLTAAFGPEHPSPSSEPPDSGTPTRGQRRTVARAGQWSLRVVEYR